MDRLIDDLFLFSKLDLKKLLFDFEKVDITKYFGRFYRADASRNTSTGGSGLGLAIAKQIIEGHGGRIWAESMMGEGTSICFTLKIHKESGEERI